MKRFPNFFLCVCFMVNILVPSVVSAHDSKYSAKEYYAWAMSYYEAGKHEQAEKSLREALLEYPSDQALLAFHARTLARVGKYQEAEKLLEIFPHRFEFYQNDLKEAALRPSILYDLAATYSILKNNDMSISYAQTVLFSNPKNEERFFKKLIGYFESDPDFIYLREDKRYVMLRQMVFSQTFNDAVQGLESIVTRIGEIKKQLKGRKNSSVDLKELKSLKSETGNIYTVSPDLINIQKEIIEYLNNLESRGLSKSALDFSDSDFNYQSIQAAIQSAKISQKEQ